MADKKENLIEEEVKETKKATRKKKSDEEGAKSTAKKPRKGKEGAEAELTEEEKAQAIQEKFMEKCRGILAIAKKKKNVLDYKEIMNYFQDTDFEADKMEKVFEFLEKNGHLPVKVTGAAFGGNKPKAEVSIDISESTQFLSALMMTAPMLDSGLKINITSKKTDGSYIRITSNMMKQFGCEVVHEGAVYQIPADDNYVAGTYQIEPDVSAACYFYAAAALTGGYALVKNVRYTSMQGDMKFLEVLKQLGCKVEEEHEGISVTGPANGEYNGVDVDMNDFSDQTMTLAAIAPFAKTPTIIRNIEHIRLQESDRIEAIANELNSLCIDIKKGRDRIEILPGHVKPGVVKTYSDHRMAMAFALIGLRVDGIIIDDYECCAKTFEDYFQVLDRATRE